MLSPYTTRSHRDDVFSFIDKVDALGGKPAIDIVDELGGMPLFGDKLVKFSLEDALARSVSKFNSFSIVSLWISADSKNSSKRTIQVGGRVRVGSGQGHVNICCYLFPQLDQPSLGMPNRNYYIDEVRRDATLPAYKSFMHDYLEKIWRERGNSEFNETALQRVIEKVRAPS